MAKNNKKTYIVFVIVLIASILATFIFTNQFHIVKFKEYKDKIEPQLNEKSLEIDGLILERESLQNQIETFKEDTSEFIKQYAIVLNNIHRAMAYYDLSNLNLIAAQEYSQGDYVYAYATPLYDEAKEQSAVAAELLNKAKVKLSTIQNNAPNSFLKEDVTNRIKQVDAWLIVGKNFFSLIDYSAKELYEINHGSEAKATEYFNKYNEMEPITLENTKKLSEIQNEIDIHWDQDWYISFQG